MRRSLPFRSHLRRVKSKDKIERENGPAVRFPFQGFEGETVEKKTGRIIQAIAGFYYCLTAEGETYECRARGVFRNEDISPLAGDTVAFETDGQSGFVTEILNRKNAFTRPPLANLDRLFLVTAAASPSPNFLVIDKLITVCEYKGIEPVIIVTKRDLKEDTVIRKIYEKAGFRVISLSNREPAHLDEIRELLAGKISAFAGNTGVGKSSLLNNLFPELQLTTADISKKLGRGRHTTRHITLYPAGEGGFVADTPGFGTMELSQYEIIRKEELAGCFREFAPYLSDCRFTGCSHTAEKGCAVRAALQADAIGEERYQSYCALYNEAKQIKDWEIAKMRAPGRR